MTGNPQEKAGRVYRLLRQEHPDAGIELHFSNPLELFVATVLSAQCTDVRVNAVTAELFKKYRQPEDYLKVPVEELEADIRSTGFFRNKAKSIRGAMQLLLDRFGGRLPATMAELTELPGAGRKTANVILGNAFGVPGVVVDTHVKRLAGRIGLSANEDPVKIEFDLMELFPKKDWTLLSHLLIFHGRRICQARKPACERCPIVNDCDFYRDQVSKGKQQQEIV